MPPIAEDTEEMSLQDVLFQYQDSDEYQEYLEEEEDDYDEDDDEDDYDEDEEDDYDEDDDFYETYAPGHHPWF